MMNDAFFEKLYVYDDQTVRVMLRAPFGDLLEAPEMAKAAAWLPKVRRKPRLSTRAWVASDDVGTAEDLATILYGHGSNKGLVVVLRCRYSNSGQLRDLLGQVLHDLDRA